MPEFYNVRQGSIGQPAKTLLSFSSPDLKKLMYEPVACEVMVKRRVDRLQRIEPSVINRRLFKFPSSLILFIKCCLAFSIFFSSTPSLAKAFGQTVTFSGKNVPLTKVFAAIEDQTHYGVFVDHKLLSEMKNVSLDVKNATIQDVLQQCLVVQPVPLEYFIQGTTITIVKKRSNNQSIEPGQGNGNFFNIRGQVTDSLGNPLFGASVQIKGTNTTVVTDENGFFSCDVSSNSVLVFSFVGYGSKELAVGERTQFLVKLGSNKAVLDQVQVVYSTGYQKLPQERSTGSFGIVNNELYNRKVSSNVLDRIDGVVTGTYGSGAPVGGLTVDPKSRSLQITIRGASTLSTLVGTTPLIVLDNVPYEGDINNLNPNDIESVSILKDAAAASIWGARAGNGVIVLTTKKGGFNKKMRVDVVSNVSIINKPDIFNDPGIIDANTFINVEDSLFVKGYFNSDIKNAAPFAALSPVVNILAQVKSGVLSPGDGNSQINALRGNDVRRDYMKYVYQKAINQQYSIGIRGGSDNMNYSLSVGHDENRANLVRNGFKRTTINGITSYIPAKNLELTAAINYNQSETDQNNQEAFPGTSVNSKYLIIYPYAQLADAQGNPLPVAKDYSPRYKDSTKKLGFLDWQYRPLDEIRNADNKIKTKDLLLRIEAKYKLTSYLNLSVQYENEYQNVQGRNYQSQLTYAARSLINKFSKYNPSTKKITYQVPLGGILTLNNYDWNSYNVRAQAAVNKSFGQEHFISGIAGAEIRQLVTTGYQLLSYGYDQKFGVSSNNLNYIDALQVNPSGTARIPAPSGNVNGVTNRYISYFINAAYTFKQRYTISGSARRDGANLFGVKTNDKITPLWSVGGAWDIGKEDFLRIDWLTFLKLRGTYGYCGNVYNGTAYVTGAYGTASQTGAQLISSLTPPNPSLRWEKVKNINLGIDFGLKNGVINGAIDLYRKYGMDLIEPITLPGSTGFTSYTGNAASTKTKGIELTLNSKIIDRKFRWSATFIANYLKDEVVKYDVPQTAQTIQTNGGLVAIKGKPLYSIFSYRWAGLDPLTGDPQGYLNKQVSKDYQSILSNYRPDSLVYNGSAHPTFWGSLLNDFTYKGFSLSVMIVYKMGYFFRKPSITGNLQDMIGYYQNTDFLKRWQKPGDEKTTFVPSVIYPANSNRAAFYRYSEVLVQKGDNIRLQDIRLSYSLGNAVKKLPFSTFQIYTYLSNLGIIWRANKYGIDPDNYSYYGVHIYPDPFSISFGVKATF